MPILNYDFDLVPQSKLADGDDPLQQRLSAFAGRAGDAGRQRPIMFREEATALALSKAPEPIREAFATAGFRWGHYDSGAPEGAFPACDAAEREEALALLAFALRQLKSRKTGRSGFNVNAFLETASSAVPVDHRPVAYMEQPTGPMRMADGTEIIGGKKKPKASADDEEAEIEALLAGKRRRMAAIAVVVLFVAGLGSVLAVTLGSDPEILSKIGAAVAQADTPFN